MPLLTAGLRQYSDCSYWRATCDTEDDALTNVRACGNAQTAHTGVRLATRRTMPLLTCGLAAMLELPLLACWLVRQCSDRPYWRAGWSATRGGSDPATTLAP
ncbi:MAG: hypothetical protein KF756_09430 [Acidobacteria bacterium]|nr:hypothetical protein [Acidobacteriota bacterium]